MRLAFLLRYQRNSVWLGVLFSALLILGTHSFWVQRYFPSVWAPTGQIYEGANQNKLFGDADFYLDGAISVLQFQPILKFNNKREPVFHKWRDVKADDFPSWAAYPLSAYPYPAFKFGYSLMGAVLTVPFPQEIFLNRIPRLTLANLILNSMMSVAIFLFVWFFTRDLWAGLICCLLASLDYSNIYNSYYYMSHTIGGLVLFFSALSLLVSRPNPGPIRFGVFAFILSFAEFTSSHLFVECALLGILGWARVMLNSAGLRERLTRTASAAIGFLLTPAYIVGVEMAFHIGSPPVGLPSYFSQVREYGRVVNSLIMTYPWYARQIWDLRLFNPLFLYMLLIILIGGAIILFLRMQMGKNHYLAFRLPAMRAIVAWIRKSSFFLLFVPFFGGLIVSAVYSQPISRAMTAHLVLGEVLLGLLLSKMISSNKYIGVAVTALVLISWPVGNELIYRANQMTVVSLDGKQPLHTFYIQDQTVVWQLVAEYYNGKENEVIASDRYLYINKSIGAFLNSVDRDWAKFFDVPKGADDLAWVAFDAMELVATYSPARRFWPQFTPRKENLVTTENYRDDFRLINELFTLRNKGYFSTNEAFKLKKFAWPFIIWDQEYNYTLGYIGGMRPLLKGTSLEHIDLKSVYFFNVGALRRAIQKDQPNH